MGGTHTFSRREILQLGVAAGLGAATVSRGDVAPPAVKRPNILLLMDDQHRADCLGAAGNTIIQTPNLDRIAKEGVRFSRAYTSTPSCTPARAALLTGMSPWRHGMLGAGQVAEKYAVEMPQLLRDAGYYTTGIGKMHWHPQRAPHGFHRTILDESGREKAPDFRSDYRAWFMSMAPNLDPSATGIGWNDYRSKTYALPEELHPTRWTGLTAATFLETYDRPEPFFLKVSFARPHSPYDPPKRLMDAYAGAEIPAARMGAWAARYQPRSDDTNEIWHGDMGAEQVRASRQGYYGSVTFVDEEIGRILKTLEKKSLLENTLILYCSDHGDMLGDHHLWRKTYAYEASAKIPMLVRWPEGLCSGPRGQVLENVVEIRDILPTFLHAAGAINPTELDGRSLLPPIDDAHAPWRDQLDLEHDACYSAENHWSAVTDGRRKFIFHAKTCEEQYFDLDSDPYELANRIGDPQFSSSVNEWRDRLIEHLRERGPEFVSDGKLALRPEAHLYSPSYPGDTSVTNRPNRFNTLPKQEPLG